MTIATALNERELATRIHDCIERLYSNVIGRKQGDAEADKRAAEELEALSSLVNKLKFSTLSRLGTDAQINARNEKALEQIEQIVKEIEQGENYDIRGADYLKGVAKKLRKNVGRMASKAKRDTHKKLHDIERKQRELEKQKKQIEKK